MENIEENKKSVNKKIMVTFITLGIIALAFVSAAVYYDWFSVVINVHQPISVSPNGALETEVYCLAGNTCFGDMITVTNDGDTEKTISVSNDNSNEDIKTSYAGELEMTRKNLDTWTPTGESIKINYMAIGDKFGVDGVPEGFVAVYYPNTIDYSYYDGVVVLSEDVGNSNLPIESDLNGGESSDYCTNGFNPEATQCKGAKIWLVPLDAVSGNVIDWSRAGEFYFEKGLIQYNVDGNLLISPHSSISFKLRMDVDEHASDGDTEITTTIA